MAIASIIITCTECGRKFEHRKTCYNRREADEHERWAVDHITTCKDCYAKQAERQVADKLAEGLARNGLTLPALTGVSDKQVAHADSKRRRYLADNLAKIDKYHAYMVNIDEQLKTRSAEIAEECRRKGQSVDDLIAEGLEYYGFSTLHFLLSATEAREVLDALH